MKKTVKILALVLLVVTTMVSCTKNNGNKNAKLIVGKWKCVSYSMSNSGDIDPDYFKWTKVGDFWNFSKDGTLNFVAYGAPKHIEGQHMPIVEIPVSTNYNISEKWLTFSCVYCGNYLGGILFHLKLWRFQKTN